MKVKVRYNSNVPKIFGFTGITLYPYIFITVSKKESNKRNILKHEWIHIEQVRREGFFKFYLIYLYEFFTNLFRYKRIYKAYRNISYENDAYKNEKKVKLPKKLE
jgi:hypothetical protein